MPIITPSGGGAGGGSTPGAAIVRGPFAFAYNTPGLSNGIAFYTPTIGEALLDVWLSITTQFDGTTPKLDVGSFVGANSGIFAEGNEALDISTGADFDFSGILFSHGNPAFDSTLQGVPTLAVNKVTPTTFDTVDPWKVVVSQDGTKGGTAVGGSTGAAKLYIVTATPVALP